MWLTKFICGLAIKTSLTIFLPAGVVGYHLCCVSFVYFLRTAELSAVNVCLPAGEAELPRKESLHLSRVCRFSSSRGSQGVYTHS
ncbi:hypothetical protein HOY80DRAFT_939982 [Tuber brumale]|nr:hypothetical protein HOY80DRAFT_939982 [Tuber brumale]